MVDADLLPKSSVASAALLIIDTWLLYSSLARSIVSTYFVISKRASSDCLPKPTAALAASSANFFLRAK
ncbi:Uncharacterised protein [Segatella copri]|nr:Uncharacterised protein [Segatella copri]